VILGNLESIKDTAANYGVDLDGVEIIDPEESDYIAEFRDEFYQLRKHKGIIKEEAEKAVKDPLYFGTMMIYTDKADGMVAGAANPTGNVLRPSLQIIKKAEGISTVSNAIILVLKDKSFGEEGVLIFSDCAINPAPNSEQLAEIAIIIANTTQNLLGFDPKVAMLSFSTMGSARHAHVDNVINAVKIAHQNAPHLKIDREMQVDAALVEDVGKRKAPESKIAGKANVLVFSDLESGNIGYKLVQRLAAPINDLSRGCSVDDIVNLTAITAVQAQNK
jgi:phosphate acetyltransferase